MEKTKFYYSIKTSNCQQYFLKYVNKETCLIKSTRQHTNEVPNVEINKKHGKYAFGYQCKKV